MRAKWLKRTKKKNDKMYVFKPINRSRFGKFLIK